MLSNVEFMLLQIICEGGELSGYEINRIVEERGYREWADIGTTSIYVSLEKLQKKHLADSRIDIHKRGRGPLPKKFKLSAEGRLCLADNIKEALSATRERDKRFDLGLSACHLIGTEEIILALSQRKSLLQKARESVERKYRSQGVQDFSVNIQYLFRHPICLINCEIEFIDSFVGSMRQQEVKK